MAKLRPCPFCRGFHRTKRAAKNCAKKNVKPKAWSRQELGV